MQSYDIPTRGVQRHHRRRKMRYRNKEVRGTEFKMCWCLCLKCFETHHASISNYKSFPRVIPLTLVKEAGRSGREDGGKERGRLRHGCRGDGCLWYRLHSISSLTRFRYLMINDPMNWWPPKEQKSLREAPKPNSVVIISNMTESVVLGTCW